MRFAIALLALSSVEGLCAPSAPQEEWIPLFNGKDLTGWTPKIRGHELGVNWNDTFRVENGVLKCSYDQYEKYDDRFAHLFYQEAFSHYRIRAEYRFVGTQCPGGPGWAIRNNGLMLHGQDPATMALDQSFPVSIEVQLLGGNGKDNRSTANLCTPGTNVVYNGKLHTPHCTNSASKTIHGDEWVTVEVEVRGSKSFKHFVNGELVMTYEQPQYDPKDPDARKLIKEGQPLLIESGTISIQGESAPTEFRKIELLKLKPE